MPTCDKKTKVVDISKTYWPASSTDRNSHFVMTSQTIQLSTFLPSINIQLYAVKHITPQDKTRNSAVVDKPRNAFCKCNSVVDLLKLCPSPCVTMLHLVVRVKLHRRKYGRTPKSGSGATLSSLGMRGLADPKVHAPLPHALPRKIWYFCDNGMVWYTRV